VHASANVFAFTLKIKRIETNFGFADIPSSEEAHRTLLILSKNFTIDAHA
jgi:hypothetical protein